MIGIVDIQVSRQLGMDFQIGTRLYGLDISGIRLNSYSFIPFSLVI